ncbi:phopshatase [Trypanosoma theileri]|uniref:protein-tyrosine-phosphatase n=1 Tax=Trypanosoma theileri TaxID=67003 RepID=A0A1X0NVC7_9TRYP|nr:phopshatase [Trypanosoma theileri]ORC88645.1 phopshatase [Trypanosoma theileri]
MGDDPLRLYMPTTYVDVSGDDSSSFSDDSSSDECAPPQSVKKFLPPPPEDIACDIEDEIKESSTSGECNLSQMHLLVVPPSLPLEFLATLILSDNKLSELNEEMFEGKNCQNLLKFDASSNNLTSIPKSLLKLAKVEILLLDHNNITTLPFEKSYNEKEVFLPSLKRVGLEFNDLQVFPVEFFTYSPLLEEVFLGQNDNMLENPVPFNDLLNSPIAKQVSSGDKEFSNRRVTVKVDNRPRFLQQVKEECWDVKLPWLNIDLHKVYPDKVLGFLYLGSLRTAQTVTVYRDLNIGYILSVARDLDVRVDPGMEQLVLPVDDLPGEDFRSLFDKAFNFIDKAKNDNKGVLLHCFAGLSRSVTVAAAYLMNRHGMTRDEALALIKEARPAAQPNPGFMEMLAKYELQLRSTSE